MKAAIYHEHGDADVLRFEDVPTPEPGPGEVLILVKACGLNHLDVLQRRGPALIPGYALPHIAGMDVAGLVAAVGPHAELVTASEVREGDRVLVNPAISCGHCAACVIAEDGKCERATVVGGNRDGGYAEYVVVPVANVHRIPDGVGFEEAAVLPTAWMTAWHALVDTADLRMAESILIHAGASGVSTAAVQLARAAGAFVIATASTPEKMEFAQRLGADVVINSATDDIAAAARAATDGRGVDVVLDHVGPAVWDASIYSLAAKGRLVFLGNTTGNRASIDLVYAYHFGLRLLGSDPYNRHEFPRMLAAYWAGDFVTPIDRAFSLAEARAAQERMESRAVAGKIVLLP
ncbi:MAG: zinc-binding dehydrogenase [Candidatus Nanopelagicales bacterium]|nr:zinc-binding dehydrogenase [Candidatus Nanopelagicales bacterium]